MGFAGQRRPLPVRAEVLPGVTVRAGEWNGVGALKSGNLHGGSMGRIVLAAVLAFAVAPQDIKWKTNWPEALKEAKASKKLAVLLFFNKGVKDCQRCEAETLPNAAVVSALQQHVCCRIDPDGTDEENALWQKLGQARPPMTYIYDPDGKLLTSVSALKAEFYAGAVASAGPAYFNKIQPA